MPPNADRPDMVGIANSEHARTFARPNTKYAPRPIGRIPTAFHITCILGESIETIAYARSCSPGRIAFTTE